MNIASEPLVSVVTPVYNEEEYLAECIESVLQQTYQNWDYTIVDNCSTDGTVEVARRYALEDKRIRIVQNQRFLDAIPNHNMALRQISPASRYCKVVLGDDWIFPRCLEEMVAHAEAHPSVGIVAAYALEGERVAWTGLLYPSDKMCGREICRRHLLEDLYVFGTANAVLYRADLVRGREPFYNEGNIHADTEVCFALLKTSDFGFVHQVLTFTRVRKVSLSSASENLQTGLPGMLHVLRKYGADYLTPEELEGRLARHVGEYYRSLGKTAMLGCDKRFWEFHKREMAKAGVSYSRARVVKGAFQVFCDALLNPKDTAGRFINRRHKLQSAGDTKDHGGESETTAAGESRSDGKLPYKPSRVRVE